MSNSSSGSRFHNSSMLVVASGAALGVVLQVVPEVVLIENLEVVLIVALVDVPTVILVIVRIRCPVVDRIVFLIII